MTRLKLLPLFFLFLSQQTLASAPAGEDWFTIISPHFRVHHTLPLEPYARTLARAFERALPELEKRLDWKAPAAIDVVVMDPSDSANGLAVSFPNTHIELFASPFPMDSALSHYVDWVNELATHELTHIVANDTTLGTYGTLRSIFGSWVKPNGVQPVWLTEGLAVFEETSLSPGGRGRSPLLEALLREAVLTGKLNDSDYTSLDRFNDGAPWWPGGNTQYLLGYAIQALPAKAKPNLPGLLSHENARTMIFSPNRALHDVNGQEWAEIWNGATDVLKKRYGNSAGEDLGCRLTSSGRGTGGQALSSDGWIYFSEEDWDHGFHLSRVRADAACGSREMGASVERLDVKRFSGPSQVAVSPSGQKVAYAAFDPGFETFFSDIYLWKKKGWSERITKDKRVRDPAFADENTLLFIQANPDTSQSIVRHDLQKGSDTILFTCKPFERLSGLFAQGSAVLFSRHDNKGHEKIMELLGGTVTQLVGTVDSEREFERNPFIAQSGLIYFAASYGHQPQRIYSFNRKTHKLQFILATRSGYADRPILLADGKTLIVQDYSLNGLNLARTPAEGRDISSSSSPSVDLHEFFTGEKPFHPATSDLDFPQSVPYSASGTTGTGLWPQYWFPEVVAAQDGVLAGASTSGNDALSYHRYGVIGQYDSRATFPIFRAYYHNRANPTAFHFEANQTNNYFSSFKFSNRNTIYSVEAIFPLWDMSVSFGTAYRQKKLFGVGSNNMLAFQNTSYERAGKTPSAVAPNWGWAFNNFVAAYPSTSSEPTFMDLRPQLQLFFPGLFASHSMSLSAAAGISTNNLLASNYYQGGGPSPLNSSPFVVRGYPTDTLFGQRVATVGYAYTLPLANLYRGLGTNPIFFQSIGLRFLGDAGTANFLGVYSGKSLQFYEGNSFGSKRIYGYGGEILTQGQIFYHVPVSLITGVHYGTEKRYGGGVVYYIALNLGIDRGALRPENDAHKY